MLSALLVVPPLLLIATLVVSGVAKLLDPADTSSVFTKLQLPRILLRWRVPRLLPYGELLLAACLLLTRGGWYVAATSATLLLFLAYFLVILRAVRLPYPVSCACFGRLGLGEVTRQTLARNAVLLALAAITWVVSWGGQGIAQQLGSLSGWVARATGIAIAVLALAFVGALTLAVRRRRGPRRNHPASEDPVAYRPTPAPYGALHGLGGPVAVHDLTDVAARLLVFSDPERDQELTARVGVWDAELAPVRVHVVTEEETSRIPDVLVDPGGVFRAALGVTTPGAVLLGTDRMLAGGPVTGTAEVAALVEAVAAELGVG